MGSVGAWLVSDIQRIECFCAMLKCNALVVGSFTVSLQYLILIYDVFLMLYSSDCSLIIIHISCFWSPPSFAL